MGYRDFRDPSGTAWQAWDVVPHMVERRQASRRQTAAGASPAEGSDRRVGIDRRMVRTTRARLGDGMDTGWLCFESRAEKRRLAPIPADWLRCGEGQLAEYCEQASQVRERPRRAQAERAFPGEREVQVRNEPL